MSIKLTEDSELLAAINKGLKENKEQYGVAYCPCSIVQNIDTVCMCKAFRELEEGTCHCGKFIKTKDEQC